MAAPRIEVQIGHHGRWFGAAGLFCRGAAFCEGQLLRDEALAARVVEVGSTVDLAAQLNRLNGFFAVAGGIGGTTLAAVDRIRSIPLFYGEAGGRLFISDDARLVREWLGRLSFAAEP